jgi:hypothetical protein
VTNEVSKDLWGTTAHRKREVPGVMGGMHGNYPSHFPMRQIKQEKSSTFLVTQIWLNDMCCPGPPWERSLRSGQMVVIFPFASSKFQMHILFEMHTVQSCTISFRYFQNVMMQGAAMRAQNHVFKYIS